MIEELPDIQENIENSHEYFGINQLEYIWEIAEWKFPNQADPSKMSDAPAIFCERYHQRNLSIEKRFERDKEFYKSVGAKGI